jgi:hypothetical protein
MTRQFIEDKNFHAVSESGHVYLFRWLVDKWSTEAAKHVVQQLAIFYIFILIGFIFLYLMIRSTSQMRAK